MLLRVALFAISSTFAAAAPLFAHTSGDLCFEHAFVDPEGSSWFSEDSMRRALAQVPDAAVPEVYRWEGAQLDFFRWPVADGTGRFERPYVIVDDELDVCLQEGLVDAFERRTDLQASYALVAGERPAASDR